MRRFLDYFIQGAQKNTGVRVSVLVDPMLDLEDVFVGLQV